MLRIAFFIVLAFTSAAAADPVPSSRKYDWTYTGVPGGIPNRTTICATFSPGATAAAINSAISSCSNGVVYLNAGTYSSASLGGTINIVRNNVTLRGAGAGQTILTGLNIINLGWSGAGYGPATAITSGGAAGSNTFTVASTTNLAVGTAIETDREDDPTLVVGPTGNGTRNISQVNVITAISGSTITVRNPLFYDFSTGTPKVKYWYPLLTVRSGIENMTLNHSGFSGGTNTMVQYCDSCWVKGVESTTATGYHFIFTGTVNTEVRDSFIHDGGTGPDNSGLNFYGNYAYGANANAKIENNIFNKDFPAIELNGSSSGFYIGYNYEYGTPSQFGTNLVTWSFDDGHAPFNIMNLYEGNIGEQMGADNYFGGTGYGTILRNYITGYNPIYNVKGDAIWLDRFAYYYNVVGNVIGSTNQAPIAYSGCSGPYIYHLGMPNLGNCDNSPYDSAFPYNVVGSPGTSYATAGAAWTAGATTITLAAACPTWIAAGMLVGDTNLPSSSQAIGSVASCSAGVIHLASGAISASSGAADVLGIGVYPDARVASTLLRWGNYDYFNNAAQWNSGEIPSGVSVPSDHVIPSSYYYLSKPAWWPSSVAWPPIGPDVTGGNGDTAGHVNKTPAQLCWESSNLATGGQFNADACYSAPTGPPVINSATTSSGTVGIAYSYSITATNAPTSYSATGLPAGLSINTSTGVISGTPTGAGISTITLGATNALGTGNATLTLTVSALSGSYSLFNLSMTPGTIDSADATAVEIGVKFQAAVAGTITGVAFYKSSSNTGAHSGSLWTTGGTRLATANFSGETASGWQTVTFSSPVAIAANTTYVASYYTSAGHYSADASYFSAAYTNGPLTALANGSSGGNGVFVYGATSAFPSNNFNSTNYWVDVLFSPATTTNYVNSVYVRTRWR